MCCFSGPVEKVTNTGIFVRPGEGNRQLLAYGMSVSTSREVAMILPLPVAPGTDEKGLRFIDLKGYEGLFTDLAELFVVRSKGASRGAFGGEGPGTQALAVQAVGNFEASFVPTLKDFSRLDARFRLSDEVWKSLPQYADYGFAVFKLKAGAGAVHPMAFEFPRKDPARLFFPTVHVHDGKAHPTAGFDHSLYFQRVARKPEVPRGWVESGVPAGGYVRAQKTQGLVDHDGHVYRLLLKGELKNADTWV
jgi:hypothetical protein